MRAVARFRETEAVAAHHHSVLQDHAIADAAILAHHGVRVGVKIVADLGAFVDHHVRMQHRVLPDAHVLAHHRERADGGAFADLRRGCDGCLRMNARLRPRRLIKQRQRAREIVIGIRRYQAGRLGLCQGLLHQDRPGARILHLGRVLGVGQERQLSWTRPLHSSDAGDLDVRVAVQRAAQPGREIAQANPLDSRHLICSHVDGFIVSADGLIVFTPPMWNRGNSQAATLVEKARQQPIRQ